MKPGLYKGMSYDDYARIEAIRSGDLNRFAKTPLHARHAMANPKDSSAMVLGRATHVAVLEPDRFASQYIIQPHFDMRYTKGERGATLGKPAAEAFKKEIALTGQIPLEQDEWDYSLRMRDAAYRSETARSLLQGKGINEGVIVWVDPETGLLCKARFDRLIGHFVDPWTGSEWPCYVDLKTSRDARIRSFSRDIFNYGYHLSAAHYIAGGEVLTGVTRRWCWIVVENEPPHAVAVYDFDDTGLEHAEKIRRHRMAVIKECMDTGIWPGYPDAVQSINLPHWAFKLEG